MPSIGEDELREPRRVRRGRGLVAAVVAVAIVGLAIGAWQLNDGNPHEQPPAAAPRPTTEATPSPATISDWTGPLRPANASLPVIEMDPRRKILQDVWTDPKDEAVGGIDIREVQSSAEGNWGWTLELRKAPPGASKLDKAGQTLTYGVVIDGDGDRVADCLLGINEDTPKPGDFRLWLTNLRTGITEETIWPPYGIPVEFSHPHETSNEPPPWNRRMVLQLFQDPPAPCDEPVRGSMNFYAHASLSADGRAIAWDYAPDAGWLHPRSW